MLYLSEVQGSKHSVRYYESLNVVGAMDSIPKNKILKFRPDTLLEVRKLYNLDKPGQMDDAIDLLEDWVKKQGHLVKKDNSREYLERAIILHKGSVERAKAHIDNLCTYKTILANCFDKFDAKNDYEYLKTTYSSVLLPNITDDNYRVLLMKFWNNDYNTNIIFDCYKLGSLFFEYMSANDYFVGVIAVFDYREVNVLNLISALNLIDLNKSSIVFMKGYAYRIKGIHFLTSSKTIDVLIKILKKIFSAKLTSRIFVHTDIETLYDYVPKEILPVELNGNEKSLGILFEEWLELLSLKDNVKYMKEILTKAVVVESYKKVEDFNEICMGLDGTFRTLNVD